MTPLILNNPPNSEWSPHSEWPPLILNDLPNSEQPPYSEWSPNSEQPPYSEWPPKSEWPPNSEQRPKSEWMLKSVWPKILNDPVKSECKSSEDVVLFTVHLFWKCLLQERRRDMLPANQIHCWEHPGYGNPHCLRGLWVHSDRRNSSRLNLQINIK